MLRWMVRLVPNSVRGWVARKRETAAQRRKTLQRIRHLEKRVAELYGRRKELHKKHRADETAILKRAARVSSTERATQDLFIAERARRASEYHAHLAAVEAGLRHCLKRLEELGVKIEKKK